MSIKITDHFFEYGSRKYFRGNAHLLEICSYGQKKDPLGAVSYLDPQNKVKRVHLENKVQTGATVGINWSQTKKSEVEVNGSLKVFGVGVKGAVSYTYSKVKSANVKLYNLFINEGPLKKILNQDANGARKYLADEGKDGRIVSEVWVVMEASLSEHFDTATKITGSASLDPAKLEITGSGGRQGTQTITLSAGSIFAYKLHKVKDWNRGKTKIQDMEADYHGMS